MSSVLTGSNSGAGAIIPFNKEQYDTTNSFDLTTYKFKAPVDGLYHFDWNYQNETQNITGLLTILFVNGSEYARGDWHTATAYSAGNGSADARLSKDDLVHVQVLSSGAMTNPNTGYSQTHFSGHRVYGP